MNLARSAAVEAAEGTGALLELDADGHAEVQNTPVGADGSSDDERITQLRLQYPLGSIVDGVVFSVKGGAVHIRVANSKTTGILHYSEVSNERTFMRKEDSHRNSPRDTFKIGDRMKVCSLYM